MSSVLVVDDEPSMCEMLAIMLKREGHEPLTVSRAEDAKKVLQDQRFDLVISDLKLPSGSGLDVLKQVKAHHPLTEVIIITAYATMENAIEALRMGAYDYQLKPFKLDEFRLVIERALDKRRLVQENIALRQELDARPDLGKLIGQSPGMQEIYRLIAKVARSKATVLITGESGTGKELVARAVHNSSERSKQAFVPVNCSAIPENLLESELFGHVRGAFTGAIRDKKGLFAEADKGTIFLDEVGELPLSMQAKLLRVLQDGRVKPVGDGREIELDARVLAATNRELGEAVRQSEFREDLLYRLNVITIHLPPLRERREDIPLIASALLKRFTREAGKNIEAFAPDALKLLLAHDYPGNVRELENLIARGVTLEDSGRLTRASLPEHLGQPGATGALGPVNLPAGGLDLERTLDDIERSLLVQALDRAGGVKKRAASVLGLSFRSLRYRLMKHELG